MQGPLNPGEKQRKRLKTTILRIAKLTWSRFYCLLTIAKRTKKKFSLIYSRTHVVAISGSSETVKMIKHTKRLHNIKEEQNVPVF